ncbi:hypothetical protein [Pseudobutyrivibrio sp.]
MVNKDMMGKGYEEMAEINLKESNDAFLAESEVKVDEPENKELGDDVVVKLLLIECIRRLSKNGTQKVHITDTQLKNAMVDDLRIDFSNSDKNKFVLKLEKGSN